MLVKLQCLAGLPPQTAERLLIGRNGRNLSVIREMIRPGVRFIDSGFGN